MEKSVTMNLRVNPSVKRQAEDVLKQLGIPMATAIDMYLRQITMTGGIPFEIRPPRYNDETEAAIQEARDLMSGKKDAKTYSSARELFDELDAEGC